MALRLTQLDETNRPAFEALLAHAWRQNWGPELARALIRWRYYDRPSGGGTWLACNDGQCVAMLDSFVRPYLLDGRRIMVREGCDWYCLPKYRPLGLGVRLMRELMACPEPQLAIGGSDATLAILPRLGWTRLPDVHNYVLPVTARSVASTLLRERWPYREAYARVIPGFIPLRRPRRAPAPAGGVGRITEWRPGTPTGLPVPQQQGLVQLLDQADRDWFAQLPPGVAQPLGLLFFLNDAPVGFSLSQIEPTKSGFDGCIVHLQTADPAQAVVDWIVAETAARLVARGGGVIRCWASNPEKVAALRRTGFVVERTLPSYWWPKTGLPAPAGIDAGCLRADDAMPFPALHGRHLTTSWLPPGLSRLRRGGRSSSLGPRRRESGDPGFSY
jgi:hypothetical protein